MIHFKWFGQACFEIRNSKTVVTDPHDGNEVGLNPPKAKGDIVTVSHGHFDHASGVDLVKKPGAETVEEQTGKKTVKGIQIKGIKSYHDKVKGAKRGKNIIYTFELDGKNICHLGDLGHTLSDEKLEEIGDVDILMIPVGGNYTINGEEAVKISGKINARVIIPMHYKLPELTVDINDEEQFIEKAKGKGWTVKEKRALDLQSLPEDTTVVKLECRA